MATQQFCPLVKAGTVGTTAPMAGVEVEAEAAAAKAAGGAKTGAAAKTAGTAGKVVGTKTAAAGTGVAKTAAAGAKVGAGTIWTGKGLSLGLGLGLGAWGPIILGAVAAAAVYGYVRSRKAENVQTDEELALQEALVEA